MDNCHGNAPRVRKRNRGNNHAASDAGRTPYPMKMVNRLWDESVFRNRHVAAGSQRLQLNRGVPKKDGITRRKETLANRAAIRVVWLRRLIRFRLGQDDIYVALASCLVFVRAGVSVVATPVLTVSLLTVIVCVAGVGMTMRFITREC